MLTTSQTRSSPLGLLQAKLSGEDSEMPTVFEMETDSEYETCSTYSYLDAGYSPTNAIIYWTAGFDTDDIDVPDSDAIYVLHPGAGLHIFNFTVRFFEKVAVLTFRVHVAQTSISSGPDAISASSSFVMNATAPPGSYVYWEIEYGSGAIDNFTDPKTPGAGCGRSHIRVAGGNRVVWDCVLTRRHYIPIED